MSASASVSTLLAGTRHSRESPLSGGPGRTRKPGAVAADHLRTDQYLRKLAAAAPTSRKPPDLAERELATVPAGQFVDLERRKFSAATAFNACRDLERGHFGKTVAVQVAVSEDAALMAIIAVEL